MRLLLALQAGLFLGSIGVSAAADKASGEVAIRQLVDEFARAENSRNPEQLSQFFTADGEVMVQGQLLARGREKIKKLITPRIPWSEIGPATYKLGNIRLVSPDIAIVDAERTAFSSTFVRSSAATFILTKEGGLWKVVSYRNHKAGQLPPVDSPFGVPQPTSK